MQSVITPEIVSFVFLVSENICSTLVILGDGDTQLLVKCHVIAVITASFRWGWQARESVQGAAREEGLPPLPSQGPQSLVTM